MNRLKSRGLAMTTAVLVGFVPLASTMGCSKPGADGAGSAMAPMAATKAPGAETPELLVARMKAGAAKEDFGEIAACLTPKNRAEMAMAMYMGTTMMVAFAQMGVEMGSGMAEGMAGMAGEPSAADKQKAADAKAKAMEGVAGLQKAYDAMVAKYGLPVMPKEGEAEKPQPTKEQLDALFAKIDTAAFLRDAEAVMKAMPGDQKSDEKPVKIPEGGLENLKIEGDKATGTVGGDAFTFAKIDGRWYVDEMPKGDEGMPTDLPNAAPEPAAEKPGA
ncbi:MAG: hypothetical protein ABI639_14050 [Thermoanaerobaculia bacterium]